MRRKCSNLRKQFRAGGPDNVDLIYSILMAKKFRMLFDQPLLVGRGVFVVMIATVFVSGSRRSAKSIVFTILRGFYARYSRPHLVREQDWSLT